MIVRTPTDQAFVNGLWTGRLEAVTVAAAGAYLFDEYMRDDEQEDEQEINYVEELQETRALMRTLKAEVDADPLVAAIEKPASGTYTGETAEDDAGDQSASTELTFDANGRVTGKGFDGVDGAYKIRQGNWSGKRVAWVEEYDEGFEVALRGQVLPNGSIRAMWASSRGIGGSVTLDAPY